jgi:hypothetical protein
MTMKKWRLAGGVILVFTLGVLAGSAGTQVYYRHWVERFWKDPAARKTALLQKLTKELRLSEAQQKGFIPVIEEADGKLETLRQSRRADIKKVLDEGFARMREKLDPGQQQTLEELRVKHDRRFREWKRRPHSSRPLE